MTKTTTTYLIENTESGHLLGAYPGTDNLDAYHAMQRDAGFAHPEWNTIIPEDIHIYDPATLDRELTDDERAALESAA